MAHNTDNRQRDVKISDFQGITAVDSDGLLTIVQNGTNFKITQADYIKSLGVTGTLIQQGPATATPILDTQGAVNGIRNLENGSGVKSFLSPQNGVTLAHNFTVNSVGEPILGDATALSPVMKSLVAGTGMALSSSNGTIILTATGIVQASNLIVINVEADFPVQDATTITLSQNKIFIIGANITTAKRFIFEDGAVITMSN